MASNSSNSTYVPTTFGTNTFKLFHQGDSIFRKEFNASLSSVVNTVDDTITIKNHFFKTGEPLKYSIEQGGTKIGISTLSPGNSISTSFLPSDLYAVVVDENILKFALTKQLAFSNSTIDITSVGIGTIHVLQAEKENAKSLIILDNIIQSPVSIAGTVGITAILSKSKIELDSVKDIVPGTILKIDGEYSKVIKIEYDGFTGIGGTVNLLRGVTVLGSTQVEFTPQTNLAYIMEGQYNIVGNKIYFISPPFEGIKLNFTVEVGDINYNTDSVEIFTNSIRTGSLLVLNSNNPPKGLDQKNFYYAIKNFENNFSFALTYQDAINKVKVPFENIGGYDFSIPVDKLELTLLNFSEGTSFEGRVFLKSNYDGNAVYDSVSNQFTGIASSFELKQSGISTVGIKSDNGIVLINNIFQYPGFDETFYYDEVGGSTNLYFIGSGNSLILPKDYDVNLKGYPRGGIILSYGIEGGYNYQPLRSAVLGITGQLSYSPGVDAISNDNITILYPGSGYRDVVGYSVSVYFVDEFGERISGYGEATISNGRISTVNIIGICTYPNTSPVPNAIISDPLNYENEVVVGTGIGTGARVSFNINDDGSIADFEFTNFGYAYEDGDILTIPSILGNDDQVPTDEIRIKILSVAKDTFSAWNLGKLEQLDDLSSFSNGTRKSFTLFKNGDIISLETNIGSNIDLAYNLLIFVNDVLQVPNQSYFFNGGTQILFSEAPAADSNIKLYFYSGYTGDTEYVDIESPIKVGDNVVVKKNYEKNPQTQLKRTVRRLLASDRLKTELYKDIGLSYDSSTYRPVDVTPQKSDLVIFGEYVSKAREKLESKISSFDLIYSEITTLVGVATNYINISDTTGVLVGDYIDTQYTEGYTITEVLPTKVKFNKPSTLNTAATTVTAYIWRKN